LSKNGIFVAPIKFQVAKIKIYDIEKEYQDLQEAENGNGTSFSFLSWIELAKKGELGRFTKKVTQQQVIDRFIKKAPKIKPIDKDEEFEVIVEDKEPEGVNREIVSETLARIYIEQQHYSRAKEVYEKLILLNPEKSNYFAALIKECKKLEKKS